MLGCGSDTPAETPVPPAPGVQLLINPGELSFEGEGTSRDIVVTANEKWTVTSDQGWCVPTPVSGAMGSTPVKVAVTSNITESDRSGTLTFAIGEHTKTCKIEQKAKEIVSYVPDSYSLVWQDEFNEERQSNGQQAMPDMGKWYYEKGDHGWGNNELQNYIPGLAGTDTCATVSDGTLKIIAKKVNNQVLSIRMNTRESWTYGYFEARLKLPTGKGTWPAFWMLPQDFKHWPADGEIDIMEEVGYRPNWVSSAIHCQSYNHGINTQKAGEQFLATAQTDFHVYALEWTEEYIKCYVDGKMHFHFSNDKKGNKDTWPFDKPFYIKLNLAWGGNWGGAEGVDENFLPATYEVDYVRVYQKK